MRAPARSAAVATGLVGLIALAGCTSDEPSGSASTTPVATVTAAQPSPSPSPTGSSPEPSPTPTPSSTALTGFDLGAMASGGFPDPGGTLGDHADVRVGRHQGYDRVVWEFPGTGEPAYQVRYVDQPLGDGSGDPVEVAGEAFLEVLVSSVGYPASTDDCPAEVSASKRKGTVFAQAYAVCGGFEGVGQTFVGLDRKRPFKVTVLTNPVRLVVDVRTG